VAVLRYWAGARAAAGVQQERVDAATLQEALDAARAGRDERFGRVLSACSFVVDERPVGRTSPAEVSLGPESVVEVLPPFAGGAGEIRQSAGGAGEIRQSAGGAARDQQVSGAGRCWCRGPAATASLPARHR
jgi:molybdopterin converting factor small subunit